MAEYTYRQYRQRHTVVYSRRVNTDGYMNDTYRNRLTGGAGDSPKGPFGTFLKFFEKFSA